MGNYRNTGRRGTRLIHAPKPPSRAQTQAGSLALQRPGDAIGGGTGKYAGPMMTVAKYREVWKAAEQSAEYTGEPRQLVRDGVWQVPPEARPKGWEAWGVKEPS